MEPIDYLRAVRRRWWIPALTILVATLAVFASAPHARPGQKAGINYKATATLLVATPDSSNSNAAPPVNSMAVLITTGQVPRDVAKKIGWTDSISKLVDKVSVTPNTDNSTITVSSTSPQGERAALLANTFAHAVKEYVDLRNQTEHQADLDAAQAQVTALNKQVQADSGLDQRNPANAGKLDADKNQLFQAESRYQALVVTPASNSGLSVLDDGVPVQVHSAIPGSGNMSVRLLLSWFLAFILGAGIVILVDRIDPRIRNKEMAERSFEMPVVAEVPLLARWRRSRNGIITVDEPLSMSAEAYRGLRTTLLLTRSVPRLVAPSPKAEQNGEPGSTVTFEPWAGEREVKVILVTSPGPAEGKTTTTANLAASFAEAGQSVMIFSSDFRRPDIHNYFGLSGEGEGISDVIVGGPNAPTLEDVAQRTPLAKVSLLTPGNAVHNPAELLAAERRLIETSRSMADIILVDTAPLLATNDASELIPAVDAVVLVCRAGRTGDDLALRTRELLARLGAPTIGIVLVGAVELPGARRYHSRYYGHTLTEKWKQVVTHPRGDSMHHTVPEDAPPAEPPKPAAPPKVADAPPKVAAKTPEPVAQPQPAEARPDRFAAPAASAADSYVRPSHETSRPTLEVVGGRESTGGSPADGFPTGLIAAFEDELRALHVDAARFRTAAGESKPNGSEG